MKRTDPRLFAYYDAFSFGLIPCRIVGYEHDGHYDRDFVVIKLTADRGQYRTYKRGEIIRTVPHAVVSRKTRYRMPHTYVHTADHDAARAALAEQGA